jgi:hypothetical protein
MIESTDTDRRSFVTSLAGVAAGLAGSLASAADEPKVPASLDLANVPPAELLLELIKRIDSERLKAEHLDLLRADLAVNLQRSARLSAFPLTNGDEPAPVFAAWRSEG